MDKRIADGYRIIAGLEIKGTPKDVPIELYKDQYPGIVKPAECLTNLPWKPLRRRHFIKNNPHDAERFKLKPEDVEARKNKKFKKEKLKYKWKVSQMDEHLANIEHWDVLDKADKNKETMQQRSDRKRKEVIKKLWSKFNSKNLQQTSNAFASTLLKMTKDIVNTIKTLVFLNLIWNAKPKHWIAFYLNPGALCSWRKVYSKITIETFYFISKEGL